MHAQNSKKKKKENIKNVNLSEIIHSYSIFNKTIV